VCGVISLPGDDTETSKCLHLFKHNNTYWLHTKEMVDIVECCLTGCESNLIPLDNALRVLCKLELDNFYITKVISTINQFICELEKGKNSGDGGDNTLM